VSVRCQSGPNRCAFLLAWRDLRSLLSTSPTFLKRPTGHGSCRKNGARAHFQGWSTSDPKIGGVIANRINRSVLPQVNEPRSKTTRHGIGAASAGVPIRFGPAGPSDGGEPTHWMRRCSGSLGNLMGRGSGGASPRRCIDCLRQGRLCLQLRYRDQFAGHDRNSYLARRGSLAPDQQGYPPIRLA
jgi:hypothetical protein